MVLSSLKRIPLTIEPVRIGQKSQVQASMYSKGVQKDGAVISLEKVLHFFTTIALESGFVMMKLLRMSVYSPRTEPLKPWFFPHVKTGTKRHSGVKCQEVEENSQANS